MTEEDKSNPSRLSWKTVGKWVFAAVAIIFLAVTVWAERDDFAAAVSRLSPAVFVLALLFGGVAAFFNGMSWRSSYKALDILLPLRSAFHVFLISQVAKYIPGSVWPIVTQMEMAKERGFSRSRAATASVISMLIGLLTAAVTSTTLFLFGEGAALSDYWYVILVIPLVALLLYPPVLSRLLSALGRLFRRPFDASNLNGSQIAASVAWALLMWVSFGGHSWFILKDLIPTDTPSFGQAMGAFALAWAAGFLFVIAPAGVGVREAALVIALGGTLGRSDALAFAIVSRVILTIVDVVGALVGVALGKLKSRSAGASSS